MIKSKSVKSFYFSTSNFFTLAAHTSAQQSLAKIKSMSTELLQHHFSFALICLQLFTVSEPQCC